MSNPLPWSMGWFSGCFNQQNVQFQAWVFRNWKLTTSHLRISSEEGLSHHGISRNTLRLSCQSPCIKFQLTGSTNSSLSAIPTRYHTCEGSYHGPHLDQLVCQVNTTRSPLSTSHGAQAQPNWSLPNSTLTPTVWSSPNPWQTLPYLVSSQGSCSKAPQLEWLKTTDDYSLPVLEAGSPK